MAALTPTKKYAGEFSGEEKLKAFTLIPSTASDTVDLSTHFDTIHSVMACLTAGLDANPSIVSPSFSGTTVTLKTFTEAGVVATDWTGVEITLWVLGTVDGV